jgi:hypothetical protein
MKKPVLVHIFYSHPYLDTKQPTHFAFEIKTKLLVENVPYISDSINMEGLFSKSEIEKECRICNPDFNGAIDLVQVKDRLIKYKNSEIDSIGLCVTEHATSAFGEE